MYIYKCILFTTSIEFFDDFPFYNKRFKRLYFDYLYH